MRKVSNVQQTINKAVIRDDIGHYKLRQCHPRITNQRQQSQHTIAFNRKTIGDITNKLQFNNLLRSIVRGL